MVRTQPNIIITGTPGVGKTTHCELVAEKTGLKHVLINQIVKDKECHDGYDEERSCWIVDEDKLLDAIEDDAKSGGLILDWHACDVFPKSWIDLVVVLRADSEILYDRLTARNYAESKVQENLDAELMDVLIEEAREGFEEGVVVELRSNYVEGMEENVERVVQWVEKWREDNKE